MDRTLKGIGIVFIGLGILSGLIVTLESGSITYLLISGISGFVSGMLFIGLGECLSVLYRIESSNYPLKEGSSNAENRAASVDELAKDSYKFSASAPDKHEDTWLCKNCGEKNKITDNFCKNCGEYK